MIITLTRTGGFTGIPLKKTIDTTKLGKKEREKIETLINNPINEYTNKQIKNQGFSNSPDRFIYTISLKDGLISRSVTVDEQALSPQARNLIQTLEKLDI